MKRSAREWLNERAKKEGVSTSAYLRRIIYMVMAKSGSNVPGGLVEMGPTFRVWGMKEEQSWDDAVLLAQRQAPPTFLLERMTDSADGSMEAMMHHPISTPASYLPYFVHQMDRNNDLADTLSNGWLAVEGSTNVSIRQPVPPAGAQLAQLPAATAVFATPLRSSRAPVPSSRPQA